MKKLGIIGILTALVFVVAISGCTGVQDKTYSKNGLNFTYPGDMKENATFVFVESPTSDIQKDTLGNDKLKIAVLYNPINSTVKQVFNFDEFKNLGYEFLKEGSNKTTQLSLLDKSANGTTIYEEIYTSKDPVTNEELKTKHLVFIKDYNYLRQLYFQTKAEDFESQQETINKIINSVTIT